MTVNTPLSRDDIPGVVTAVVLVNVIGGAPAALGGPDSAWFQGLVKPTLYPPPWLFGVVWTTLFTLLGVALYLVWQTDDSNRRLALGLFVTQMGINVAWTPVFFRAQNLELALAVIGSLFVVLAPMTAVFWRIDRKAGGLVVPYLLWVTFAAVLNYRFLVVN